MRGGSSHIYARLLSGKVTPGRYVAVMKRALDMQRVRGAQPDRLRDALEQAHERLEACLTHAADAERVAIEAYFGMAECKKVLGRSDGEAAA